MSALNKLLYSRYGNPFDAEHVARGSLPRGIVNRVLENEDPKALRQLLQDIDSIRAARGPEMGTTPDYEALAKLAEGRAESGLMNDPKRMADEYRRLRSNSKDDFRRGPEFDHDEYMDYARREGTLGREEPLRPESYDEWKTHLGNPQYMPPPLPEMSDADIEFLDQMEFAHSLLGKTLHKRGAAIQPAWVPKQKKPNFDEFDTFDDF